MAVASLSYLDCLKCPLSCDSRSTQGRNRYQDSADSNVRLIKTHFLDQQEPGFLAAVKLEAQIVSRRIMAKLFQPSGGESRVPGYHPCMGLGALLFVHVFQPKVAREGREGAVYNHVPIRPWSHGLLRIQREMILEGCSRKNSLLRLSKNYSGKPIISTPCESIRDWSMDPFVSIVL